MTMISLNNTFFESIVDYAEWCNKILPTLPDKPKNIWSQTVKRFGTEVLSFHRFHRWLFIFNPFGVSSFENF